MLTEDMQIETALLFQQSWSQSWQTLAPQQPIPLDLMQQLLLAYQQPQRHYHTLQHLMECIKCVELHRYMADHPEEIVIALWFHDAIYDVHASDNEQKSAEWAAISLKQAGFNDAQIGRIVELILITQHEQMPKKPDQALMIDIDLSILAASDARFAEYQQQIRQEYSWVSHDIYEVERRKVLLNFFQRNSIFNTDAFLIQHEKRAKNNLKYALNL